MLPPSKRERSVARLPRRKITSLRVARVDVYGGRNNARARGRGGGRERGEMLRRRQRARPCTRIYGTKIVTRPLANFPFKINVNGRRSETRGLVYSSKEKYRRRRRRRRRREMPCIFRKTTTTARSRVALIVQIKNYSTPHHHPFLFSLDTLFLGAGVLLPTEVIK